MKEMLNTKSESVKLFESIQTNLKEDDNIITYKELHEMYEKLKNEYLGKEMTLLEMDNLIQGELNTTCSLFEDMKTAINDGCWGYVFGVIDYNGPIGITVYFDVLDKINDIEDYNEVKDLTVKISDFDIL